MATDTKVLLTSATAEVITPGRVARCCIGVRGLQPCLIERLGASGSIFVRPMNRQGDDWEDERRVTRDDVYFLLTEQEVAELELPA